MGIYTKEIMSTIQDKVIAMGKLYEKHRYPDVAEGWSYYMDFETDVLHLVQRMCRTDGYSSIEMPLWWVWEEDWSNLVIQKAKDELLAIKEESKKNAERHIEFLRKMHGL